MTDTRRDDLPPARRLVLSPLAASLIALACVGATPVLAAEAATEDREALPALDTDAQATRMGSREALQSLDSAGERLGWLSRAEILKLPEELRPMVDATCPGAWVTPIGPNVVTGKPDVSDIKALADSLTYSADGETQLSGHVRIEQAGRLLEADSGQITRNREYGRFDGNIRLAEPGLLLTGDQIVVNLETSAGQLSSSEFVASQMNAHGRADRIRRYSDGVTILDHGIFTTCAPGKRAWSFEARDITLDPNTGVGKIYNAKLRVADVPVIYLPYFRFPIDDRRQSGILVPRFGNTNDGGFDFSLPVYLNLAPQLDATLTPRLLTSRGAMLESEFRYLSRNFGEGTLNAAILPDDRQAGRDRKSASLNQRADWGNGWSARTSLNYVSDNAYFTDLGTDLTQANKTHQERVGEVFYDTDFWHFTGRVQGFQTIDPGLSDADHPYSRLPQLLLTTERSRLPGLQHGLRAEVANFQRNIDDGSAPEINGTRLRLDPQVRYEYAKPWGYVRPGAKLSYLQYMLDGQGVAGRDDTPGLLVPTVSLDAGLYFERALSNGGTQTLEPRIYYLNAPYKDQSDLPNFDSANTTFSYEQLFRDSRFSGGDRIDDANQLAVGVTSRWMNEEGFEHLQASLGQITYFRDRDVRLPVTCTTISPCVPPTCVAPCTATPPPATSPTSSFAGNVTLRANEEVTLFADLLMDPEGGRLSQYSAAVSVLPQDRQRLYNAGYRYRRDDPTIGQKAVSQTQLSFVQPLGTNWKVLGLWNYDIKEKESQEALFGISYESCCWQVSLFKRSFLADAALTSNSADRKRDAIFVEITLKGLTGLSSGVGSLFEKNVFGYTQLQHKKEGF